VKTKNLGIVLCMVTIVALILNHSIFWLSGELSDGNHIAQDFYEAGLSLQLTERIIGFVIAGIPVGFFAMSLAMLAAYFYNNPVINQLNKSSVYALGGAISLVLYPTILSFIFIATASMESNTVIISLQPMVAVLLVVAALFSSIVYTLNDKSKDSPDIVMNVN
jgi:pilus assembly protein TadC